MCAVAKLLLSLSATRARFSKKNFEVTGYKFITAKFRYCKIFFQLVNLL